MRADRPVESRRYARPPGGGSATPGGPPEASAIFGAPQCSPLVSVSVTIRDVARQAGVSISTVSRVLNDTCPVREDKRKLVLEAAETLGYVPNPAARSLHGKQTGAIGVLLPFVSGEFFSELLNGLDEAAQEHGRFLLISTSHRRPDEFEKAIRLLDRRVDGLVVMAPEVDVVGTAAILKTDTPVVMINTYARGLEADVYNFDNRAGARALTEHLVRAGHRHIAYIHGPAHAHDAIERAEGYREAIAAAGLDERVVPGGFTREDGYAAAERLVAKQDRGGPPLPTAIVAANDYCAMGAMSALHAHGITVPDDVAIVGFDGLASGQYAVPPLTTVRVPIAEIGRRAVAQLVARLGGGDGAAPIHEHVVPVELVVRESSA